MKRKSTFLQLSFAEELAFVGLFLLTIAVSLLLFAPQHPLSSRQRAAGVSQPIDGEGIYDSCDPGTADCVRHLKTFAAGGFKLVLNYGSLDGSASQLLAYADAAQAAGVKIIWGMDNKVFWNGGNPGSVYQEIAASCQCLDGTKLARYVVKLVKNHPATWGYYVGDELHTSEHTKMKAYSDMIHEADPKHPRLFIGDANADPSAYVGSSPFWDTAEVIGDDYYPIGRPSNEAPLNTADYTATVAQRIQTYADQYHRASAIVLQALNWGGYGSDPWVRSWCSSSFPCDDMHFPTYNELSTMHRLTLQNMQPRLILWYSYFDILMSDNPASHWADLVAAANARRSGSSTGILQQMHGATACIERENELGTQSSADIECIWRRLVSSLVIHYLL